MPVLITQSSQKYFLSTYACIFQPNSFLSSPTCILFNSCPNFPDCWETQIATVPSTNNKLSYCFKANFIHIILLLWFCNILLIDAENNLVNIEVMCNILQLHHSHFPIMYVILCMWPYVILKLFWNYCYLRE